MLVKRKLKDVDMHNIIEIHNNVLLDWQYYVEYSHV